MKLDKPLNLNINNDLSSTADINGTTTEKSIN